MSNKHTPGPWTQGTSNPGRSCVWLDGNAEPENTMGPDNTWIDCVSEANARLIAAAPDLLEALHLAVKMAETGMCDFNPHDEYVMNKARAAIAKATGGTT